MSDKACYLKLKDGVSKSLFNNVFLNLLTMELEFDAVFEVKVFGCNHAVMNNDDETVGVCYIKCESSSSYRSLEFMLHDVFSNENFEIISPSSQCFDNDFSDGFILWQI